MPFLVQRAPYVPAFLPRKPRSAARGVATSVAATRGVATNVGVAIDVGPKATGDLTPIAKKSGTGLSTSQSDVDRYIGLLEPLLESLDNDVTNKLVWNDPEVLEKSADSFEKLWPAKAAALRADAEVLRKRAATRTAAHVEREIAFSKEWRHFYARWPHDKSEEGCVWLSCVWDRIEVDDLQYQALHRDFETLGYAPTRKVPPHEEGSGKIPWGWIIAGFVLIGAALFLGQVRGVFGAAGAASV